MIQQRFHYYGNLIGLNLLSLVLAFGFYIQFAMHHLPCPLCLLQRIAFVAVGIAIILNLSVGCRARHYGLMILSALFGLVVSMRHLFLHILPGDAGFGPPILSLHLYTWCALTFGLIIFVGSFSIILENGFHKAKVNKSSKITMLIFMLIIALNAISTLLECGLYECPANPTIYKLLPT